MEPLSAAASILAVVGAARKAAEGLHRLKAIKNAPKELEDLLLEFSQTELVLQSYKNLPTNFQRQSPDLATVLGIAENKFVELDEHVHYTLTKAGSNEKVDRLQWVRKRLDTERLREQLGQILVTLNTLLSTTSFTTLQEISFTTNEVLNEQKRTQSQVVAVLPGFAAAASQMCQRIEESQTTQLELIRLLGHVRQANLTGLFGEGNLLLKDDDEPTGQLINPSSRLSSDHERKIRKDRTLRTCQRYCRCNCHQTQRIWTPRTWRKCIGIGSMRISGRYSLQKCNIGNCKQSASLSMRVDYILPTWFILRMVSIWYDSSPLHGPEYLLRVPVVLPWPELPGSRDVERYAQAKNEHIDHWLRTPSHIDEEGCTLLFWASIYERYDVINHLLDMDLDLHQPVRHYGRRVYSFWSLLYENLCDDRSSYCTLWQGWAFHRKRLRETQQDEVISKVNWDEYIADGGLSELHLIVSGFRNRDLEKYIRAHPEELEKNDESGYGPLWYASTVGELADIRTLLKYGAILDESTFDPWRFLERFGHESYDLVKEFLSSGALTSAWMERWARSWFVTSSSWLLDDDILAVDKLFLEHGFDINHKDYEEGETVLMSMLQESYPGLALRVKQLLDHGADLELTDIYGKTALHHCIETDPYRGIDPKTFSVLLENGARLDYRTWDGTTILHALIRNIVYLEPISIVLRLDTSGLLLDAKGSNGYTAFDLLILRARLFRQDLRDCSVSIEVSRVDEYYEAPNGVLILGKWMWRAKKPGMERKVLTALEILLHKVQELQGIPPEEQYPSVESVLEQEDKDAEASKLEGLPGSWPE